MLKIFSKKTAKPNGRIKRKPASSTSSAPAQSATKGGSEENPEQLRRKRSIAAKRAKVAESRLHAQQAQTKKMLRMIHAIVQDNPAATERVVKAWIEANGNKS